MPCQKALQSAPTTRKPPMNWMLWTQELLAAENVTGKSTNSPKSEAETHNDVLPSKSPRRLAKRSHQRPRGERRVLEAKVRYNSANGIYVNGNFESTQTSLFLLSLFPGKCQHNLPRAGPFKEESILPTADANRTLDGNNLLYCPLWLTSYKGNLRFWTRSLPFIYINDAQIHKHSNLNTRVDVSFIWCDLMLSNVQWRLLSCYPFLLMSISSKLIRKNTIG
jgi:hypothetical protein